MPAPDGQPRVRWPAWLLLWLGVVMGSNALSASVPRSRAWAGAWRAAAHRNPGGERSRLPAWGHAT
jgi:gamma-glutamylcysteine synthetase